MTDVRTHGDIAGSQGYLTSSVVDLEHVAG